MLRFLLLFLSLSVASLFAADNGLVGDAERGKIHAQSCMACHGADGNSLSNAFPKIAGQHASYLLKQLLDYQSKKRNNPVMYGIVEGISKQDMIDLAAYFSEQKTSQNGADKKANLALAERIYRGGKLDNKTAACIACHGPRGKGIASAGFPSLSFQYAKYSADQLRNFRQYSLDNQLNQQSANTRMNDENDIMRNIAAQLTDLEIEALAEYIAGLH